MQVFRAATAGFCLGVSLAIDKLEEQMLEAAAELNFEKAAKLRDQLLALRGERPIASKEKSRRAKRSRARR